MLWFSVWTVLVLATLVGAVLLALRLWRSVKALLTQLRDTGEVLVQVQTKVAELEALRPPEPAPVPAPLADEEQREGWRQVRAANRVRRDVRRSARHALVHRRWDDLLAARPRS